MATGDYSIRTIKYEAGHKAMLLRRTRHGDEEVASGYAPDPSMALRELYRVVKRLLGLVEQAGQLAVKLEGK